MKKTTKEKAVQLNVALPKELRKALKLRAASLDIPLNQYICNILTFEVQSRLAQ